VLITGSFSTMFCLIVDPIEYASCVVVGVRFCFALVIIDGSSIALARTIEIEFNKETYD
jgi:hypothetical protein